MSISMQNDLFDPVFESDLDRRASEKFPEIFGQPNSWADITDFVLHEREMYYQEEQKKIEKKRKKEQQRDKGWETVSKKEPVKKQAKNTKQKSGDALMIRNVPLSMTKNQIKKKFEQCDGLKFINTVPNKGLAFIKFRNRNDAAAALASVPFFMYKGEKITIIIA